MNHATRFGGSNALRRLNCPASLREEKALPKVSTDSAYADDGTAQHRAGEFYLNGDAGPLEEMRARDEENGTRLADAVDEVLDMLREFAATFDDFEYMTEVRVDLAAIVAGAWGHTDLLWSGKRNGVKWCGSVDFKFGAGIEVEARGNTQLGFYLLGAVLSDDPDVKALVEGAEQFALTIMQPARYDDPDTWVAQREWLDMLADYLVAGNARLDDPNAPHKMGPWCRFCKAKLICPEQTELADRVIVCQPAEMTAVELDAMLRDVPQLEQRITKLRQVGHAYAEQGVELPSFKLVEKRSRRFWISEDEVRAIARKRGLLVRELEAPRKLKSPNQLELAVKKKLDRSLAKEVIEELRGQQDKSSTGYVLVPVEDKRKAVAFGDLAESLADLSTLDTEG